MRKSLLCCTIVLLLIALGSCGGSTRQLQSISVSPAAATGSAQFTATGMFSQPPSPMMLNNPDVAWCIGTTSGTCAEAIVSSATVDSTGKAQCAPQAQGVSTVVAFDPNSMARPPLGPAKIFGTAQLTCP